MRNWAYLLCAAVLSVSPALVLAEQEVALKSGASFIGDVTIDGDAVVVVVDDAKLRVPLADVAAISPLDAGHRQQAHRLLMTALEAKLMNNAGKEVLALLAEAARLDPEDPRIAYWYADCLVDSGFGKAAGEIFDERQKVISNAYPGMSDRLSARIQERLELEKMPPDVVEQIDKLSTAAAQQTIVPETRQLAAVFRLVDQNQRPIERSAFRIESHGQDDHLESFDDGYYFFTFNQNRHNRDEPCRLEINQPGLEPKTFQFTGTAPRVENAGEFVVQRYDESSKIPFRARVVDRDGKPVSGATIALHPVSQSGNSSGQMISSDSDADGRIEMLVFPMKYNYHVQAKGFSFQGGDVELSTGDAAANKNRERQITLHRAIQATVQVAWLSTSFQGGGKSTAEATLQVTGGPPVPQRPGQDTPTWIRPIQIDDRLILQFMDMPFGYQGPASEAWVRVVEADVDGQDSDAQQVAVENFKSLELNKLEQLKEDLPPPEAGHGGVQSGYPQQTMSLPAALGKVYVGRLSNRDMRTGQPVQVVFKVVVEEMRIDSSPVPAL